MLNATRRTINDPKNNDSVSLSSVCIRIPPRVSQSVKPTSLILRLQCTINGMSNLDSASFNNDPTDPTATPETRTQALNRIRSAENERMGVERTVQKRLMWMGIVVGATVGLMVGYLATLITIVDSGVGEFGFQFFRPNFVDGFLRLITAYMIGGGAVGAGIMHVLFTTRHEANSIVRWVIAAVAYSILAPLLIGFLLPLTLLIFGDFVEGLRPGLWLSAFIETLLGSFLDGYIFLIKVLYAGVIGALLFVAISVVTFFASLHVELPPSLPRKVSNVIVFNVIGALIGLIPLVIIVAGPFSLTTSVASLLTGERL